MASREKMRVSTLDPRANSPNFPTFLPDGVMAAPEILDLLVMVRIHVGQPFEARGKGPLAHGLRLAESNLMNP